MHLERKATTRAGNLSALSLSLNYWGFLYLQIDLRWCRGGHKGPKALTFGWGVRGDSMSAQRSGETRRRRATADPLERLEC